MRYIKKYENFTPIKINNEKPFKFDDSIADKIAYMQDSLKKLRKRVQNEKDRKKQAELNNEINAKVKRLSDLTFKQTKQVAYLKNNPITESSDIVDNAPNLIKVLSSKNFKPEDITEYIGFEEKDAMINAEKEYRYPYTFVPSYDEDGFTLIIRRSAIEDLLGIENGSLEFALQFNQYNGYDYYVDDDELNYLGSYIKKGTINKIVKLSKMFKFNDNIVPTEEGEINDLFQYLDLIDDLDTFKGEMGMAHERAIAKAADEALKKLPFNLDNNDNHDRGYDREQYQYKLVFEYKAIIEYMKKYKLDVKSIKELLSNIVDSDELNPESIEYDDSSMYINYDDLSKSIDDVVTKYIESPDDIFKIWIEKDNLEMFKKFEEQYAFYNFDYDFWYNTKRHHNNLFMMAKLYNGKILEWFKTYDFQKKFIEAHMDYYKIFKKVDILNQEIENEFSYIVNVDKFNI